MSRYFIHEGGFDALDVGLTDATVNVLALAGGARLFVEREPARAQATAFDHAVARTKEEGRQLDRLTVLGEREGSAGGVAMFEVAARYREGLDLFYQRRAHLIHRGVAFVITLRGALGARDALDARMDHVLATLRFRAGG